MTGAGRKKPTLGYPSRSEAIMALLAEGKTVSQIADQLVLSTGAVSSMRSKWVATRQNRPIDLPALTFADLAREARKRQVNVDTLAGQLLGAICRDKLFQAILDD